jgi:hypothetical protein
MPPYGLYPIPSQHLYKKSPANVRPRYNTMAFQEPADEAGTAKVVVMEAAQVVNNIAGGERKDKVKDDKKGRKKYSLGVDETLATRVTPVPVPTYTRNSANVKKSKKKSSLGVNEMPITPVPVPTSAAASADVKKSEKKDKDGNDVHASKKKRKRESEIHVLSPSMVHNGHGGGSLIAGTDRLQNLKSSHGGLGTGFDQRQVVSDPTEKHSTKKIKSKRKSKGCDASDMQAHEQAKVAIEASQDEAIEKKELKKEQNEKKRVSTQVPGISFHSTPPVQEEMTTSVSPYVTTLRKTPRKTPIPLPQKSYTRTIDAHGSPHRRSDAGRDNTEVIMAETHPSRLSLQVPSTKTTPIPFNLPRPTGASSGHNNAQKAPNILPSPPVVQGNELLSCEASESFSRLGGDIEEPNFHPLLTSSSLARYTQPLSDEPKPHPLRRSGSMSSASSMSIEDAFARASTPSPHSSAEINPFFTPSSSKKSRHKTPFDAAMSALRATIDFSAELSHLSRHLHIRAANDAAGALPCLTKATGCTIKQEAAIALMHSDPSLTHLHASDSAQVNFASCVSSAQTAESFLHRAVLAHVPVPVGILEGIYTLYCPKYTATHIDKYGFGHRTLTISRPSGFNSNMYTARLHIPPRSTTFSICAFEGPAHASFREIELSTTVEGYVMRLVVLGNGYVVLRVDLNLLLQGKALDFGSTEDGVGMEFLGVRERDVEGRGKVEWGAMWESVMRQRKRDEKVGEEVEERKEVLKKKRGRPSKVELARRAKEKEKEGLV